MRLVSSLSEASSTAMCEVRLVTVAWIRCWNRPWPNWIRLCSLSRIQGIRRSSAARTSDMVLGPSARRWAKRMNSSRSAAKSKSPGTAPVGPQLGRQQRVEQREAQPAGLEAHVLLLVLVDDVVVARRVRRAGLAEGDRLAGHVLQLDGDVLEDVAHPGALALGEPPDEPARLAVGAAVLVQPGQRRDQRVGEGRPELARGPLLQRAEVHARAG